MQGRRCGDERGGARSCRVMDRDPNMVPARGLGAQSQAGGGARGTSEGGARGCWVTVREYNMAPARG